MICDDIVMMLPGAFPKVGDMDKCLERAMEGRNVGGGPRMIPPPPTSFGCCEPEGVYS
jgi:hypothetical protein